jgi:hypothetical protein
MNRRYIKHDFVTCGCSMIPKDIYRITSLVQAHKGNLIPEGWDTPIYLMATVLTLSFLEDLNFLEPRLF